MSLRDKLIKNSTVAKTAILSESSFFIEKEQVPTAVPMINVALSGTVDGGVSAGLTTIAGPSKHFKTAFSLLLASAFLNKHKDSILLFYDTEFGTPQAYFDTFNIPTDRVIHTPITDIEELKHDIMSQLKDITDKDKVCIIIDSIGNIASRKEVEDAEEGKTVADMSRAKQLKSLFRMVTPHLSLKRIPMFVINHTYKTLEMFSKDVVSGGTGVYYSSDNVWIVGRQQEKPDKTITGYHFVINIEKSRYVVEKSKIPITVMFDGGINKWSGLFDIAKEGGYIEAGDKKGKYTTKMIKWDGDFKESEVSDNTQFWEKMLADSDFSTYIEKKYKLVMGDNKILEEEVDG